MKKLNLIIFTAVVIGSFVLGANAQMMNGPANSTADWNKVVEHTAQGEQKGKALWDKLQTKQIQCANLNDEDFDALGEYFMGQMMGSSHAAMNAMMIQAHGEPGEEQIHITMAKRLSGCDTIAVLPVQSFGWMPMMQMMWGTRLPDGQVGSSSSDFNSINNMMNFGYGYGAFGWLGAIFMVLWWVLIVIALIALIRWLAGKCSGAHSKSALDILKERYARGEISQAEFEEKKKDLSRV